jgi:ABC-type glutathione transport system ATPase component
MTTPALRVAQLTKTFGSGELAVSAVRAVDLDVAAGEVVLIMAARRRCC